MKIYTSSKERNKNLVFLMNVKQNTSVNKFAERQAYIFQNKCFQGEGGQKFQVSPIEATTYCMNISGGLGRLSPRVLMEKVIFQHGVRRHLFKCSFHFSEAWINTTQFNFKFKTKPLALKMFTKHLVCMYITKFYYGKRSE